MAQPLDLEVRSHRLHAVRHGPATAPLVVALHGLTGSSAQLAQLAARLGGEGLQVLAVDLRGRGASDRTGPGSYGWDEHALDVVALADALGAERFAVVGLSMGGSVAMQVAELAGLRTAAVVLLDVAGRVDPGVGSVVSAAIERAGPTADPAAVAEDRQHTLTQDPYERWRHLTMPVLLVRATREIAPDAGFVVPVSDRDRFQADVPTATIVEVDADHLTIADHPDTAEAAASFLGDAIANVSPPRPLP